MKRRILTVLCALAILAGIIAVTAAATDANTAATIGSQGYTSLQDAVDAGSTELIQLKKDADAITVNHDVYIDLNGHSIASVTVENGTLYGMDSQTDDYTVADGNYGKIVAFTGSVAGLPEEASCADDGYLMVTEDEGISFHRVNLDIYAMSLRASKVGVYYKSNFAGDELVAANVDRFGVALSVVEAPNAQNLSVHCGLSWFKNFKSGAGSNVSNSTSTLLYDVMKQSNEDTENARNASIPVYGRAYILTSDGEYLFGGSVSRCLKEQVELAAEDEVWTGLSDSAVDEAVSMYRQYTSLMRSWDVANIESALCLDKTDPLVALENGANIKVLAITSSFGLNTTQMLYDVIIAEAEAQGIELGEVTVARLYTSGCTLEKHLANAPSTPVYQYTKVTNDPNDPKVLDGTLTRGKMTTLVAEGGATLLDGLQDEDWDIIFMQQGAAQAPQLNTYIDANGNDYIDQVRAIVDQYKTNPNARFVWNMLWGYQSDSTVSPFPTLFNSDQMYMYQCNIDAVMTYVIPRTDYDRIIPTGTVIQNARSSEFGDNLCRDTYHLNNYGGIMAAYGLFTVLTGQEVTEINIDAVAASATNGIGGAAKITTALTDTQKAIMVESVNNALKDPFHVTESKYPTIDYSAYKHTDNLVFDEGTNLAVCTACQQKVSWIEVSQSLLDADDSTIAGYFGSSLTGGTYHFYLSSDISYTAASTSGAFLNAPGSGRNICLHLNGNDLTAENCAVAILAGTSTLNIMGTGEVVGNHTNSQKFRGSTIILNAGTTTTPGTVRLYSGTYIQPAANTQLAPVSISWQGGLLEIYEDATLTGNADNYSLCLNTTNGSSTNKYTETVNIYGGIFKRRVYCNAFDTVTTPATALNVSGGTFNDGIEIVSNTDVTLSGAPVIRGSGLILPENVLIDLGELESGASILVKATGVFTNQSQNAGSYAPLFSPAEDDYFITVVDNALKCADCSTLKHTDDLVFDTGTTNAFCTACGQKVTWTALNQDNHGSVITRPALAAGQYHFYLAGDITYTASSTDTSYSFIRSVSSSSSICLHLNGHDLTATNNSVITVAGTKINLMGNGVVTGNATMTGVNVNRGTTLQMNSGSASGIMNIYSGTYKMAAGSTNTSVVSGWLQGGTINIYEDAQIIGNGKHCVYLNTENTKCTQTVNIYGGSFSGGDIYFDGTTSSSTTSTTIFNLMGGNISGGIQVLGNTAVTVSGSPTVSGIGLVLAKGTLIKLGALETGAAIAVSAENAFTEPNSNASELLQFFTPVQAGYSITVVDNSLYCQAS